MKKWGKIDWNDIEQRREYRRNAFKEYRKKYPDRVRESQRKYLMRNPSPPRRTRFYCQCGNFVEDVKHLRHKTVCRECYNMQMNAYIENPENQVKLKARRQFHSLIVGGYVERENCQVCGKKAQPHHPDYAKPLQIIWLCPSHHGKVHHGHEYNLQIIDYEEIKNLAFQEKKKENRHF